MYEITIEIIDEVMYKMDCGIFLQNHLTTSEGHRACSSSSIETSGFLRFSRDCDNLFCIFF